MTTEMMTLEEKVEKLITGYKALQEKYKVLQAEKETTDGILTETRQTVAMLEANLQNAKADIADKELEIAQMNSDLDALRRKAERFEQSSKTAAAKIDDILDQLDEL
jgi:chromosome segregation ATPase